MGGGGKDGRTQEKGVIKRQEMVRQEEYATKLERSKARIKNRRKSYIDGHEKRERGAIGEYEGEREGNN